MGIACACLSNRQNLNLAVPIAETAAIDRSKSIPLEALFTQSNPFEEVKQSLLGNAEQDSMGGYRCAMAAHDPYAAVGVRFCVTCYR